MHERQVSGPPTGALPVIVPPETHERLVAVLSAPKRRTTRQTSRSYVLSGVVKCSHCGAGMVGRPTQSKMRRYVCDPSPGRGGCGKRAIQADPLEELVLAALERIVQEPIREAETEAAATRQADPRAAALRQEHTALCDQEAALSDYFFGADNAGRRLLTQAEFTRQKKTLISQREAIEEELARVQARKAKGAITPGVSLRNEWAKRDREWRREVVELLVGEIRIEAAVRGRNRFDPERVVFANWRA
jgi:site-specific DNA recombinase